MRGHFPADGRRIAGEDTQHAARHAGTFGEMRKRTRRVRGLRGRLADEGAARRERRSYLARNHGRRKIPRCDGSDDADRLAQHEDALVRLMSWDDVAVEALTFFAEPLDEHGGVGDFPACLSERLALLGGHDADEILLIR